MKGAGDLYSFLKVSFLLLTKSSLFWKTIYTELAFVKITSPR